MKGRRKEERREEWKGGRKETIADRSKFSIWFLKIICEQFFSVLFISCNAGDQS
jgi:hypothetical protein